jgi:hypothetical protein
MDKLYLIVVKMSSEEIISRESKPALEERREHHNLIRIGYGNIFSGGGAPLQHGPIGEERTHNKFVNFFFIYDGRLKEMRMGGCHWWSEGIRRHRIGASAQAEITGEIGGKNGCSERNVGLGAARSLFIEGGDSNSWQFGSKHVKFGSTVNFRSNSKELVSIYLL